jgi:agmatinase
MDLGVDPFEVLRVVDHGDSEVSPSLETCHIRLQHVVESVLRAGATPVILGGDHSLSLPVMRGLAGRFGAEGYSVLHFDAHADTEADSLDVSPHASPFYRAVAEGYVDGENLVQVGLRGAWPHPREFTWMRGRGIRWYRMDDIEAQGIASIVEQALAAVASRAPRVYLTVDIDVLDPAFAPGTGTPEPGGLTTRELLRAIRIIGQTIDLCAMDLVEVSPPYDPSGITARAGHRVVLEALSAVALRKTGRHPAPERPTPPQLISEAARN